MSEVCADLLEVYGTYVDVTFQSTGRAREMLFDKATTIVNIANYAHSFKQEEDPLRFYGQALKELFDKIETGEITPASTNVIGNFNVETVKRAHQLMEKNETKGKKLIMKM